MTERNCSKCEANSLKSLFPQDVSTKDGLSPICKVCSRGYFTEKFDQAIENQKKHNKQNRAQINL